jgi:hypothetical protein
MLNYQFPDCSCCCNKKLCSFKRLDYDWQMLLRLAWLLLSVFAGLSQFRCCLSGIMLQHRSRILQPDGWLPLGFLYFGICLWACLRSGSPRCLFLGVVVLFFARFSAGCQVALPFWRSGVLLVGQVTWWCCVGQRYVSCCPVLSSRVFSVVLSAGNLL